MNSDSPTGACGLECVACDIYRAQRDPALAQQLAERFRARGRADARPDWFHCSGCRGDRAQCWSDDCWIRECCVNGHGLEHCGECAEFPCGRLQEWAGQSDRYAAALARLRSLRR